jgi:hypothetical protein
MVVSQNGYPANDPSVLTVIRPVPIRAFRVRAGAVAQVMAYVIAQFDSRVEDIEAGELDDWSYAERPVRGGTDLSNHASGTAVDLNSERHPLGTSPAADFTEKQINTIYTILNEVHNVVRWGGSYTGRQDPMHFEINAPESRVAAAVAGLGAIVEVDDVTPADLKNIVDQTSQATWVKVAQGLTDPAHPKLVVDHSALDASVDSLTAKVAALSAKVDGLAARPVVGGAVDLDALATKLADLLAKRLAT